MKFCIYIYLLALILFLINIDFLLINEEFLIAITLIIFFILVYRSLKKIIQTLFFVKIDNIYFSLFFLINSVLRLSLVKLVYFFSFYIRYNFFIYKNLYNYILNLLNVIILKNVNLLTFFFNSIFVNFSIDYLNFLVKLNSLFNKALSSTMVQLSFYEKNSNLIFIK
jgi:hypothetical protein